MSTYSNEHSMYIRFLCLASMGDATQIGLFFCVTSPKGAKTSTIVTAECHCHWHFHPRHDTQCKDTRINDIQHNDTHHYDDVPHNNE